MSKLPLRMAVCVAFGWLSASAAAAGDLHLQIQNGRVTLSAKDVSVRDILGEWARVGAARVVNADKVLGGPISLELADMPEKQALDVILRNVSGYLAAPRPVFAANQSVFDRILILATSSAPASAPPRPAAPASTQPQFPGVNGPVSGPTTLMDDEEDDIRQNAMPAQPPGVPGIFNFGNPQQVVPIPAGATPVPLPMQGVVTPVQVGPGAIPTTPSVTGYPAPVPATGSTPSTGTVAPGIIVPPPTSPSLQARPPTKP